VGGERKREEGIRKGTGKEKKVGEKKGNRRKGGGGMSREELKEGEKWKG